MRQRDPDWRQLRLGDTTASRFPDLMTKPSTAGLFSVAGVRGCWDVFEGSEVVSSGHEKKADAEEVKRELADKWKESHWSATAESYLDQKLAELIHCVPADKWTSAPTDWGTENEPHAFELSIPVIKEHFGEDLSLPVDDHAYIHHISEPFIGCSPDGIIGDDGLLEIKCPYDGSKWIRMYRRGLRLPKEYIPQVQGSLWVTGRQWYAFVYFDPRVTNSGLDPLLVKKVERDDHYINTVLAPRVTKFRDWLREEYEAIVKTKEPF